MSYDKKEKKQEITAEGALAPQLGADPKLLAQAKFDIRRQTNLPNEILAMAYAYFNQLEDDEGGEFIRAFFTDLFYALTGVHGWETNKQIQMVAGSKGAPSVGDLMKKPGLLQRNITRRDWERKAKEEGKTVVE